MAENWNTIFSRTSSRDYTMLATEDSSVSSFVRDSISKKTRRHSIPPSRRESLLEGVEYSEMPHKSSVFLQEDSPNKDGRSKSVQFMHKTQTEDGQDEEAAPLAEEEEEVAVRGLCHCCKFVESAWFLGISAVVIIFNVITTIVELDKPETKDLFFISDQITLGFYVMELFLRAAYCGCLFLCGPCGSVCWNLLDIIVVMAGMLDQWLFPFLPVGMRNESVEKVLQLLRLLRLLRILKIVRVFLTADLSWTEAAAFQSFIGFIILINSLLMGMEIDVPWNGWFYVEQVLLCIYVFELGVRLKNFGKAFFSCKNEDVVWNILDFAIVSSSVLDSWITPLCAVIMKALPGAGSRSHKKEHGMSLGKVMMLMRMLRLMRILRLAKLVKSVRPLFILVTGVMAAIQGVAWVLVLTIVTLYAMGILATSLIGKKMAFPPGTDVPDDVLRPFSSVPDSMFTLFRVMSGAASDAEQEAIDDIMNNVPSIKFGFVFFMITSSWTLLSILTAVVSENMISTTDQQEEEIKIQTAEEDRFEHVSKLKELFDIIDNKGDGQVEKSQIEEFLADKNNAVLTARRCRVPVRDVREVLQTVAESCDGTEVSLEKFVDYLADVSKIVTEKSIMKVEAKLRNLHRDQAEGFSRLRDHVLDDFSNWQDRHSQNVLKLEEAAEACAEALQNKDAVVNLQMKEVQRLVQGISDNTEVRLSEMQEKNKALCNSVQDAVAQVLDKIGTDKFTEVLELQIEVGRMQQEVLSSLRSHESSKGRDGQEAATLAKSASAASMEDTAVALHEAMKKHSRTSEEQAAAVSDNRTDVADVARTSSSQVDLSAAHMEARLLAIGESVHGLQQKTETMLRKNEGILEKMSKAVDSGPSAFAADKFSESLESELRLMKREVFFFLGRQSPHMSKVRNTTKGNRQLVVEPQTDLASIARASGVQMEVVATQMEARLLASQESINSLHQKTEAMFRKIEGLLENAVEQGLAIPEVDRFSDTLERELRTMRQELLCSLEGKDAEVSKLRE